MKTLKFLSIAFALLLSNLAYSQCNNNPSLQAGDINPAPLLNGQGGQFTFTYAENLLDYTDEESNPVRIIVSMINIAPVNGVSSLGGTFAGTFDWTYDTVTNSYLGIQNRDIFGGTGGSITVDFVQTNPIDCPDNQMGFNANIIPAPCMNGVNQTDDDQEASFTCNQTVAMPLLSVADAMVDEDSGSATVEICLDQVATGTVSVDYATADDSATGADYTASSGTVSIPAGQLCATVSIAITDDVADESNETFMVNLSNIVGSAMIIDDMATVTIIDNDEACNAQAPVISN